MGGVGRRQSVRPPAAGVAVDPTGSQAPSQARAPRPRLRPQDEPGVRGHQGIDRGRTMVRCRNRVRPSPCMDDPCRRIATALCARAVVASYCSKRAPQGLAAPFGNPARSAALRRRPVSTAHRDMSPATCPAPPRQLLPGRTGGTVSARPQRGTAAGQTMQPRCCPWEAPHGGARAFPGVRVAARHEARARRTAHVARLTVPSTPRPPPARCR